MKTDIIPQLRDIETREAPLALNRFFLSESVLLMFPNAPEIFRENTLGDEFPITYSISPLAPGEYRIIARANQIIIASLDSAGLMYALFTLSELDWVNGGALTEFDAFDKPALHFRGFSDDISRGMVPTTQSLFDTIRRLARYKYNIYMPYMEDTFRYETVPGWGRYSDPIGREEWRAVIAYAKGWNISIRPIVNLLGHFDKLQYIEELQPLALRRSDGSLTNVMDPRKPEVRTMISRMLAELVDCFGPGAIHCGGDEPGALTEVCGRQEAGRLFIEHYSFVSAELKKLGCGMMIYADFFAPAWGDYSVPVGRVRELPSGTDFVFWDYAVREEYPMVDALHRQKINIMISPASISYRRFSCDFRQSFGNVKGLLKADAGRAKGMVLSTWADGGTSPRELAWPGTLIGANFCWAPESSYEYEEFFTLFHQCFYGFTAPQAALLEPVYHYDRIVRKDDEHPLDDELFRDPFEPVRFKDGGNIGILQAAMRKAAVDLASLSPRRNREIFAALFLTVVRASFTADKIAALPRAEPKTMEQLRPYADRALALAGDVPAMKELHRQVWFSSNRASEWTKLAAAYDDLYDGLCKYARNGRLRRFFDKKQE